MGGKENPNFRFVNSTLQTEASLWYKHRVRHSMNYESQEEEEWGIIEISLKKNYSQGCGQNEISSANIHNSRNKLNKLNNMLYTLVSHPKYWFDSRTTVPVLTSGKEEKHERKTGVSTISVNPH